MVGRRDRFGRASFAGALTVFIAVTASVLGVALLLAGGLLRNLPIVIGGAGAIAIAGLAAVQIWMRRPNPSMIVMFSGLIVVGASQIQPEALTHAAALCLASIGVPLILLHGARGAPLYLVGVGATMAHLATFSTDLGFDVIAALAVVSTAVWGANIIYHEIATRLRQSEQQFRAAFDRAPIPTALLGPETFQDVNEAFAETFGYRREELLEMDYSELTHPDDLELSRAFIKDFALREATEDFATATLDKRYLSRDGSVIWARTAITSLKTANEEPLRIVHVLDTSPQRRALAELRHSEERFRSLVDLLPVGIWEEDYSDVGKWLESLRAAGVEDLARYLEENPGAVRYAATLIEVLGVNPAAIAYVGATGQSEMLGKIPAETISSDTEASLTAQFLALWDGRTTMTTEVTGTTFDGSRIDGQLQLVVPTVGERPDLGRVVVAITDLTRRRLAERELEERVDLENLIAQLSTHFINLNPDETHEGIDEALEAIGTHVGADRSYVFQIDFEAGVMSNTHEWCADGVEPMKDRLQDAPVAGFPWIHDWVLNDRPLVIDDVAELPDEAAAERAEFEAQGIVSLMAVPMLHAGSVVGFVGFDLLHHARHWSGSDTKLLRLVGEMFVNALERTNTDRRVNDLIDSKDQLIASVSHELRTPLTAILGLAEELRDREDLVEWEQRDLLEVIAEQSHELANIVEDLLVASRVETDDLRVTPGDISLQRELGHVMRLLPTPAGREVTLPDGDVPAWADAVRVRQILRNLITNSYRYGGNRIELRLAEQAGTATVSVWDDGAGVPAAQRGRIFDPYRRAHETPGRPGSLGLGLAVSRRLAKLMGGDLRYRHDRGSVFELTLPTSPPAPQPEPADPFPADALVSGDADLEVKSLEPDVP